MAKRILTVGVYDLLHRGHVALFKRCKDFGEGHNHVIVAVQDSDAVLKFKPGAKLIGSTEERVFMVKSIRYVDEVVVYGSVDDIVKKTDFDILAAGPDQNHEAFQKAFKWCKENGKQVVILPRTEGISSSGLKNEIKGK